MQTTPSLRARLAQQLGFLTRSCESYDGGYQDEAIRIAAVLRVLFHTATRTTSLLDRLGESGIHLLSTCPVPTAHPLPPGRKFVSFFWGLAPITIAPTGIGLFPNLDDAPSRRFLPLREWWSEVVFRIPPDIALSRCALVLNAANKEGGAHVDPVLTPDYEALLSQTRWRYSHCLGNTVQEGQLSGVQLVALRQMGFEALHSPDLVALCE